MRRLTTWMLLFAGWMNLPAQFFNVGVLRNQSISAAVVYCSEGSYQLISDGKILGRIETGGTVYLTMEDGNMKVLDAERDYGYVEQIEMRALTLDAWFSLKPTDPELASRKYDDNLIAVAGERFITLINQVDIDKYLAGAVESEAGFHAEKEFIKAQSILSRTFAMDNLERHQEEGFQVCDGDHCQVYHGKSTNHGFYLEAILETTGVVVADYNFKLITAAFHTNSGGQTSRAGDVWLTDLDYLQSVVDPYSLQQEHAKWTDTIAFDDWKNYLIGHGMSSVSKIPEEILYVEQRRRKKFFVLDKDSIKLTTIREDWGFNSSFFDMFPEGDSILIWGKGYGHGVGMSQEGAMKMARDGFNYQDILKFYFYEVRLMDFRDLPGSSLDKSKLIY
jgi:stage II sporulation protein D